MQIERIKSTLNEQTNFQPCKIFLHICKPNKHELTVNSLKQFLQDNKVDYLHQDLQNFFFYVNQRNKEELSYLQFCELIQIPLSVQKQYTQNQKPYQYSFKIYKFIAQIIKLQIEQLKFIQKKLNILSHHKDFNLQSAYQTLSQRYKGYISQQDLGNRDIISFILLKFDRDKDQIITYKEFEATLQPYLYSFQLFVNHSKFQENQLRNQLSSSIDLNSRINSQDLQQEQSIQQQNESQQIQQDQNSFESKFQFYLENQGKFRRSLEVSPSKISHAQRSSLQQSIDPYDNKINYDHQKSQNALDNSFRVNKKLQCINNELSQFNQNEKVYQQTLKNQFIEDQQEQKKVAQIQNQQLFMFQAQCNNLSRNLETKITFFLHQQMKMEKEIEILRQKLSLSADFNLKDAFSLFSQTSKQYLELAEFQAGLEKLGIQLNREELWIFFKLGNKEKDKIINFSEFSEIFIPKQKEYKNLMNQNPIFELYSRGEKSIKFTPETQRNMTQVFIKHYQSEKKIEQTRMTIFKHPDFITYEQIFKFWCREGRNFIIMEDVSYLYSSLKYQKGSKLIQSKEIQSCFLVGMTEIKMAKLLVKSLSQKYVVETGNKITNFKFIKIVKFKL